MSLRAQVVRATSWSAVQTWLGSGLGFVTTLVLARLLRPEDFGLIAMAGIVIATVQIFHDQGFTLAIIQREKLDPEHTDTAFIVNVAVGVLCCVITFVAAPWIAAGFREPALAPVVRWVSPVFVIKSLSAVQTALLRRAFAFRALAVRTMFSNVIGGAIGLSMAFLDKGVWSLVGMLLVRAMAEFVVLWRASTWRPGWRFSRLHFSNLFNFGISIVGNNAVSFLTRQVDHLLIGYYLGTTQLGYYSIGYRVLKQLTQFMVGVAHPVAMSTFSRLQSEPERLRAALYTAIRFTALIVIPAFLGTSSVARELVNLGLGEAWGPTVPVIQVLCCIGVLYAGFYYNPPVWMAVGRPAWNFYYQVLQAILNVTGYIIVLRWGITAVAAVYVVRAYVMSPLAIWMLRAAIGIKIRDYLACYVIPTVGTMVMMAVIYFARTTVGDRLTDTSALALYIGLGVVTYAITVIAIGRTHVHEAWRLVQDALAQRRNKKA